MTYTKPFTYKEQSFRLRLELERYYLEVKHSSKWITVAEQMYQYHLYYKLIVFDNETVGLDFDFVEVPFKYWQEVKKYVLEKNVLTKKERERVFGKTRH